MAAGPEETTRSGRVEIKGTLLSKPFIPLTNLIFYFIFPHIKKEILIKS